MRRVGGASETLAAHRELEHRRILDFRVAVEGEAQHDGQRPKGREPLHSDPGTVAPLGDVEQIVPLGEGIARVDEQDALEPDRVGNRESVLDARRVPWA